MVLYRRIDQLPLAAGAPTGTDIIEIELDPEGTPSSAKITIDLLAQSVAFSSRYASGGGFTQAQIEEFARDAIAAALVAGAGITITPNDGANTITLTASGGGGTAYTQAEIEEFARDAIAAALQAGSGVTIASNDANNTITISSSGGFTQAQIEEIARDAIAAALVAGTGMSITSDDAGNTITLAASSALTQAQIEEFARDAIAAALVAGTGITITPDDVANTITLTATGSGSGVPPGGVQGQMLTKTSATDGDVTWAFPSIDASAFPISFGFLLTPENSAGSTGTILKFRTPYAMSLSGLRLSQTVTDAGTATTVDILNGTGISVMGAQKLQIAANQKTSVGNPLQPTLQIIALGADEEVTINLTAIGAAARGVKLWLLGVRDLGTGQGAASVPSQVTNLVVTRASTLNSLSWSVPANNGSLITSYEVQRSFTGTDGWVTAATPATNSFVDTGLENGTIYYYRVRALNGVGLGPFSTVGNGRPATTPDAPTGLTALSPTATSMGLTWSAPAANGGEPITSYIVEWKLNSTGTWAGASSTSVGTTSATINGLTGGSIYNFRVSAVNAVGASLPTTPVNGTTSSGGTAVSFVASAHHARSDTLAPSISSSSLSVQAGDILLCTLISTPNNEIGSAELPSGFTILGVDTDSVYSIMVKWGYRIAGSSEPTNYVAQTVALDGDSAMTITNVRGGTVVIGAGTYYDYGGPYSSLVAPSVSPTQDARLVCHLELFIPSSNNQVPGLPSGMSQGASATDLVGGWRTAHQAVASGATGTRTSSLSPSPFGSAIAISFAVR